MFSGHRCCKVCLCVVLYKDEWLKALEVGGKLQAGSAGSG